MKICYLLLVGVSLTNTLKSNEILTQALAEHAVDYTHAAQLTKEDLGGLFVAQDAHDNRRIQIKSVAQSSTGDEELRGASCGYHAFRNGTLSAFALINKGEAQGALKELASQNHAHNLFGTKSSPWRIEVGRVRNEPTARKVFRETVYNSLTFPDDDVLQEYNFLIRCAREITVPALARPAVWEDGFHYSVTKKEVYASLIERLNKLALQGGQEQKQMSKALINNRTLLDKYFNDDFSIDFTIDFEGVCTRADAPKKLLARVAGDKYGNWLQTDEMPTLVNAQRDSGILEKEPTLFVATYGEDLGGDEHHAFASEKFTQLYALIRETKNDCVGVVLVYLSGGSPSKGGKPSIVRKMFSWFGSWFASKQNSFAQDAQEIQSVHDSGHWISLVVSRIKGDIRYYVHDSLGNANRLRNSRVNEIIDVLDGKKSLPGYSWTARQVSKQSTGKATSKSEMVRSAAKLQLKEGESTGYSWTQIGLGALATGLFVYAAHHVYNDQKKKKNP